MNESSEQYFNRESVLLTIPKLRHRELELLFLRSEFRDKKELEHILLLPEDSLLDDLQEVIRHGIDHTQKYATGKWRHHPQEFILHALFILGEIGGDEATDIILDFLWDEPMLVEFWIGDHQTESMPSVLADAARADTGELCVFILDDDAPPISRNAALGAVGLMYHRGKIERSVLEKICREYYGSIVNSDDPDKVFLVTLLLAHIKSYYLHRLLDLIDDAFSRGLVDADMWKSKDVYNNEYDLYSSGTESDVIDRPFAERYLFIEKIQQRMQDLGWLEDEEEDDQNDLYYSDLSDDISPETVVGATPKTGRNDPCPCGSGKKYKKCHGMVN